MKKWNATDTNTKIRSALVRRLAEEKRIVAEDPLYNELINRLRLTGDLLSPLIENFQQRLETLNQYQKDSADTPMRQELSAQLVYDLIWASSRMEEVESEKEQFDVLWIAFCLASLENQDRLIARSASMLAKCGYELAGTEHVYRYLGGGIDASLALDNEEAALWGARLCFYGGYTLYRIQKEELAEDVYRQGILFARKAENRLLEAGLLIRLAQTAVFFKKYEQAYQALDSAISLCDELKNPFDILVKAMILQVRGRVLLNESRLEEARPLLRKALETISSSAFQTDNPELLNLQKKVLAECLYGVSLCDYQEKKYYEAQMHASAALRYLEECEGEQSVEVCNLLNQLGWICRARGDLSRAQSLFERSYLIRMAHYGRSNLLTAISSANMAGAFGMRVQEFNKEDWLAIDAAFAEAILLMDQNAEGPNRFRLASVLLDYCQVLIEEDRLSQAAVCAREALEAAAEAGHGVYALYAIDKGARISADLNEKEELESWNEKADQTAAKYHLEEHPILQKIHRLCQTAA